MVRLIDADALKEIYTRNFDYENCIYDGATVVGNVDDAPTVDAVPVSFLLKLQETAVNDEASEIINEIIARWEREREEE